MLHGVYYNHNWSNVGCRQVQKSFSSLTTKMKLDIQ